MSVSDDPREWFYFKEGGLGVKKEEVRHEPLSELQARLKKYAEEIRQIQYPEAGES